MSNTITAYNPTMLAQESLIRLENALGMGKRVYMGYDAERRSFAKGDTIQIPKPGGFTATTGGAGTIQDLSTEKVTLTLDQNPEVLYTITDKELAYTTERIVQDHVSPAMYTLASYVDAKLTALYKTIPWSFDDTALSYANFLSCRKVLRDVGGTLVDMGDNHFAIDSTVEASFLGLAEWKDASSIGIGQNSGLISGSIGERAGVQPFVNQNLVAHTGGTVVSAGTDVAGALTADAAKYATSIAVGSLSGTETLVAGDSFVIAGNTQRYVVTANATLSAGAATLSISPPLVQAYTSGDVVTFENGSGTSIHAASYYSNLMFNRRAFAIAFAPLPMHDDVNAADIAVVTDPRTGMSVRVRIGYDTVYAKKIIGFDILFGVTTLDPNKAVIYRRNK